MITVEPNPDRTVGIERPASIAEVPIAEVLAAGKEPAPDRSPSRIRKALLLTSYVLFVAAGAGALAVTLPAGSFVLPPVVLAPAGDEPAPAEARPTPRVVRDLPQPDRLTSPATGPGGQRDRGSDRSGD